MHRDSDIADIASADDVAATVEEIYGTNLATTGVVHVAAVRRRRSGVYEPLRAGSGVCRCAHDVFIRNLTRARADAILTTGEVLRRDPALVHSLRGPEQTPQALADWRRQYLGKRQPPVTLVLTASGDIDLDHPVLRTWTRPVVYTGRRGEWRLESRAADHGVELVGVDEPHVRGAVDLLRHEFGAATIAVEAGPEGSRQLYEPTVEVDELLLSVCETPLSEAPELVGDRGGRFLEADELGRIFAAASPPYRVETDAGVWSFQRFLR